MSDIEIYELDTGWENYQLCEDKFYRMSERWNRNEKLSYFLNCF